MSSPHEPDEAMRARMPADVDAPDKVLYGLTFRQLALLAATGLLLFGGWRALHRILPAPVLVAAGLAAAALSVAVAVGRRDGQPLDTWLLHAVRYQRAPHALTSLTIAAQLPVWVEPPRLRMPLPAPLRLPAQAIGDDGEIRLGDGHTAIVAATTVNLALRTPAEQAALLDAFGRWLNSLSVPTQILVSAQPVDLASHADTLAAHAAQLRPLALAAACADHAAFLADLATRRDPLHRRILITHHDPAAMGLARRRADGTARALTQLAVTARALDGPAAPAALAGCADPYRPPRPGGLATSQATITGPPADISIRSVP
jgi:hypothetical protein